MAVVCRTCGLCPTNETWLPFAMPIGTARERHAPCALPYHTAQLDAYADGADGADVDGADVDGAAEAE